MNVNQFEIISFQRIGDIFFSYDREKVRNVIGGRFDDGVYVFEEIVEQYDYFPESDIKVLYDKYGRLDAVEFYRGKVLFDGYDIFSLSFNVLKEIFQKKDKELKIEIGFLKSQTLGIGIGGDEEDGTITSVIAFRKGYYD
jgi:hypothetical protein